MNKKILLILVLCFFLFTNIASADLFKTLSFGGKLDIEPSPDVSPSLLKILSFGGKANVSESPPPSPPQLINTLSFGGKLNVSENVSEPPSPPSLISTLNFGGHLNVSTNITPPPPDLNLLSTLSFGGKLDLNPELEITDVSPANNSGNVDMYSLLSITVESAYTFDINWSTNHSSWTADNLSCNSGTFSQIASFVNLSYTDFYWNVSINDSEGNWLNRTFKFTTKSYVWSGWSDTWEFDYITVETPVVLTNDSSGISSYNATLNGYLVSDGDETCNVGFQIGTYPSFTDYVGNTTKNTGEEFSFNYNGSFTNSSFYYDSYSSSMFIKPDNMTDGNIATDARGDTTIEPYTVLTSTNYSGEVSGLISNVYIKIRAKADGGDTDDKIIFKTLFNGSDVGDTYETATTEGATIYWYEFDISNDSNAPDIWQWSDVSNLDLNISVDCVGGCSIIRIYQVEVLVDYRGIEAGQLYLYRSFANNSNSTVYGMNKTFLTYPLAPAEFEISYIKNTTSLNLSWVKGAGSNYTRIERNTSESWNRGEGTLVYNDTGTFYIDTGLNQNTTYYYQLWGYATWTYNPTLFEWSFANVSANTTTFNATNDPSAFIITNTTMTTMTMEWINSSDATHYVIVMNETGYAGYPNTPYNGTEEYNNTLNYTTITGLLYNTTYYFSLWAYNNTSGFFSSNYVTANDTTNDQPNVPVNFTVERYNDTVLNLSWVKQEASDYVVIRMNTSSYPNITQGIEIYNGSGTSLQKSGLTPATHYYFTAWGYNLEVFSISNTTADNITLPQPPQNLNGDISPNGTSLNITWDKGIGADTTHIRNQTGSYPSLVSGNLLYNDTGLYVVFSPATSNDFFTAYSFAVVDGIPLFSEPAYLLWGGLEINVYKENNPSIEIHNYTVFISNQQGTETFENVSANNPFRIDVSDVPNGNKIAIQVSRAGYYTQTQYRDLNENQWYVVNFYLPVEEGGSGGGDPSDPDYIPPYNETDPDINETYGELYLLTVLDVYDQPIEDVKMEIQRYINTTEEFDTVTIRYTDANGQVDVYLIPDSFYKVILIKEGYYTEYADYIPSGSIFTKTFKMNYVISGGNLEEVIWDNITWSITPNVVYHRSNITIHYNISCDTGKLEWFDMAVQFYNNSTASFDSLFYENSTLEPYGGNINYTTPNITGRYYITCRFKKENFSYYTFATGDGCCRTFFITWETITEAVSEIPVDIFVIIGIFLAIAGMALMYKLGAGELAGYGGITIMVIVFMLRPDLTIGGVAWYLVMLVTGIVYTLILFLRGRI